MQALIGTQILENLFIHSDSKPAKSRSTSDSNGEVQTHDKGKKKITTIV